MGATVIVRIIGTLLLFFYIKRSKVSFSLFESSSKEDTLSILKITTPTAIERLIMRFGQVVYFGLILKIEELMSMLPIQLQEILKPFLI